MEKSQYNLCAEVIERLHRAGVLQDMVIIGSWCIPFYRDYFAGADYFTTLRTRDIDFLLPLPGKIHARADIPELLKDLGFIRDRLGEAGYVRLIHPDLIVEFLVPEKGRGSDKAYPLPQLGLNAQSLRFLDFLSEKTISITVESIPVKLPHPIYFALHKLIIAGRRLKKEKTEKDTREGLQILNALIAKDETETIRKVINGLPLKWKKTIIAALKKGQANRILEELKME